MSSRMHSAVPARLVEPRQDTLLLTVMIACLSLFGWPVGPRALAAGEQTGRAVPTTSRSDRFGNIPIAVLLRRAKKALSRGAYHRARSFLEETMHRKPSPQAAFLLSRCLNALGWVPQALAFAEQASTLAQDKKAGQPTPLDQDAILKQIQKLKAKVHRRNEALKLLRRGRKAFDEGEYIAASNFYRKAFGVYQSPPILLSLAGSQEKLGRYVDALNGYRKALSMILTSARGHKWKLYEKVARVRVAEMSKKVAKLRVVVDVVGAKVVVAGQYRRQSPLAETFVLNPGQAAVLVTKKGYYPFEKSLTLESGHRSSIKVGLLIKIRPKVVVQLRIKHVTPLWKRWWFWTALGAVTAGTALGLGLWYGRTEEDQSVSAQYHEGTWGFTGMPVRW